MEERNLLSVGYTNYKSARLASWKVISRREQKEKSKGNQEHVQRIHEYRMVVERELSNSCCIILSLLDEQLIPTAVTGESQVFYLRMKGAYHCSLAECKTSVDRKEAAKPTRLAYQAARDIAMVDLPTGTPFALVWPATSVSSTT